MPLCDDLRIGGTLSGTGIAGGISINNSRIGVSDWSGIFGHVGLSYQTVGIAGRPGAVVVGDGLPLARFLNLNLLITRWNETGRGALTAATPGAQLWENTDLLLSYLSSRTGFYLEVDHPDGTDRFVHGYAVDPAPINQSKWRRISVPVLCAYPYWRLGGTQSSSVISGAGSITPTGDATIYDAVLSFSGNGTFTNSTAGWSITIAGSGGACVVDLGARTVKTGGVNTDNRMTRTDAEWGWFTPGANTVTSSVSVTVTYRNQWE